MKKVTFIVFAILLILVLKIKDSFFVNVGPKNTNISSNTPTQSKSSSLGLKESIEGPVTVAVTPGNLEKGSASWDFQVVMDTHSEELSEDLVAVSQLIDDQGKSYKPLSWEGAPPGGHHRSGVLKFSPISPKPKSVELKVKNVGGIAERSFKWIF